MRTTLKAPVSVLLSYDHKIRRSSPTYLLWEGRQYKVTKVGLPYHKRIGRTLYHIFSVLGESTYFKIVLNSETLEWQLEELDDGQTD